MRRATEARDGGVACPCMPDSTSKRIDEMESLYRGSMRRVVAGPEGIRLLVIGGVPGSAFTAKDFTELGAPDPAARR